MMFWPTLIFRGAKAACVLLTSGVLAREHVCCIKVHSLYVHGTHGESTRAEG